MEEEKEKALEELEEIRKSGKFNMFMERRKVLQYANDNRNFHLVSYCGNDSRKYLELLKELGKHKQKQRS